MKTKLLTIVVALALVLSLAGIVVAAPNLVSSFTITPSSVYTGDSVTFTIDFTVATGDTGVANTLCLYYPDAAYRTPLDAVGNLTSAMLSDTYVQEDSIAPVGTGTANCPGVAGLFVTGWSIADPNNNAEFGDTVSFSFAVPTGAATETFQLRQRNATVQVSGSNKILTINSIGVTVYVANDSGSCGSNSPCLTGQGALNQAIDGVTTGGTVIVLGAYNMSPSTSADLTDARTVTLAGQSGASLNNAAGACSPNAMIEVSNASANLTVTSLSIDGSCTSGNRAAGVLNTNGTTNVRTGTSTIRDFTGSGNAGVEVVAGTMIVENNTFSNNQTALEGTGGTLYAFANNVTTNNGTNAATGINDGTDNVRCNYWGSAGIDSSAQYLERLGSPVSSYIEGTGSLGLGQASLPTNGGNEVLISLGRSTSNPPFNNGTVSGLGALVSDFFAACGSRSSTMPGALTITGDSVTPGTTGFRLYSITNPADCSPSDNTACWDYQGATCGTAGCTVTDGTANAGHFVVGNEVDPTAITLRDLSATTHAETSGLWVGIALAFGLLMIVGWSLRRRAAQS